MHVRAAGSNPLIVYPDGDGQPMADNTRQLRWIVVLFGNLLALFRDRDDVFIASNLFWYPVEGEPDVRVAPDVLVVFGRPRGDRLSYKQWEEGGVPLTVVFEILSPGNTVAEMDNKLLFYEERGVEEYYVYDPDSNHLMIFLRQQDALARVRPPHGFISPRLGLRFDLSGPELVVHRPDGFPCLPIEELDLARRGAEQRAAAAEAIALTVREQFSRLAELSRKARRGEASGEELAELDGLERQG